MFKWRLRFLREYISYGLARVFNARLVDILFEMSLVLLSLFTAFMIYFYLKTKGV